MQNLFIKSKKNTHFFIIAKQKFTMNATLYIHYMTWRAIYQNIFPEVTGKPWRVMSPDAEGRG
jgi:hypothetical protein